MKTTFKFLAYCLLALTASGCCVFKLDNAQSLALEPVVSVGGACINTESDGRGILGYQIGGFLVFAGGCPELEDLSVATGLIFSGRGYSDETQSYEEDGPESMPYTLDRSLRTNYLDIPLVARVPITSGLSAYGGPQASFLVGAKETITVNGQENVEKGTEGLNSMDFGFTLGLNYELNNGIRLGLGMDQGLTNVYKSEYGSSKSKNQVFKATVALNINKFKNH